MDVDLAAGVLTFSGLAGAATKVVQLRREGSRGEDCVGFVSLYNRGAEFRIVEAVELS